MNTYTINLQTKNSEQFDAFLFFIKSFGLIELLDIKKNKTNKQENILTSSYTDDLVLPPQKKSKIIEYYGLWEDKNISNLKQFRENLWQR